MRWCFITPPPLSRSLTPASARARVALRCGQQLLSTQPWLAYHQFPRESRPRSVQMRAERNLSPGTEGAV
jgi:hypothetical protein